MDGEEQQYLPGAASLLEQLDKKVMIISRDGRHLVGLLRSFDQYLNLVLDQTFERILLPGKYCDVPLGLYIVRGETIVLVGEVDKEGEALMNTKLKCVLPEDLGEEMLEDSNKVQWDFE